MSQHIHLIGICGTGMAALAGMLKQRGHRLTGSDLNVYPPMSTFLEQLQIPVYQGFDQAHLQPPPDAVIVGNAISRGNPEVEYVLNEGLRYFSLPEALKEFFIRGKYSCVVAGTHGKTTTSSLLAWTLESAGLDPSLFIGGIPENFGQGFKLGNGRHFVLEGDEYDSAFFDKGSKFFHYLPNLVILNNIEYDHADIFKNFEEIKTAFRRLINIIPGNGYLVACTDDPAVREMLPRAPLCGVATFGAGAEAEWRPVEIHAQPEGNEFFIEHGGEKIGPLFIPLAGEHNVKNATAVFAAAACLGVPAEKIKEAFAAFRGVRRRLQIIYDQNEVLVLDDFAHHPTEVRETLRGVRQRYPDRRLWAVFEPRTASTKRKVFEPDYIRAFDAADSVVFAPMHRPDKVPEAERLSLEAVVEGVRRRRKSADIVPIGEEMANFIIQHLARGDVVVFMSNGDFAGMPSLLAEKLNAGAVIKETQFTRGRTMTEERIENGSPQPMDDYSEPPTGEPAAETPAPRHGDGRPERRPFDRDRRYDQGRPEGRGRHDQRPGRYRPRAEGGFERSEDDARIKAMIQEIELKLANAIQPVQLENLNSFERKQIHQYIERNKPEFETKTYRGEGDEHVLWIFPVANLKKLAKEKANEALTTDCEVAFPPMSSYERFILHNALKEVEGIEAISVGEGAERHIEIQPKKFGRGLKKIMKKIKLM
ncbi:MAG: UDP-N-acetylmuramate:L-alanyl-gamma-D-glutamyl-meso-diaminopimelate ligase [bacterium]